MKKISLLGCFQILFFCSIFIGSYSCKSTSDTPVKSKLKGIPVVIADGSAFPSFLAGIWRQEGDMAREFIISKDGRITSSVLGMGLTRVSPDKETIVPMVDGTKGSFVPGPWTARFNSNTREFQITLEMSSFRMQAGQEAVEGVIRESFTGVISEDGKRWDVDYFGLPEIHAYTQDGEHHVLKDGNDPDEEKIVFNRVYSPYEQQDNTNK